MDEKQKDFYSSEKDFKWTDELVREFVQKSGGYNMLMQDIDFTQFKQSKMQPKYPEGILQFANDMGQFFRYSEKSLYQLWVKENLAVKRIIHSAQGLTEPITIGDEVSYNTKNVYPVGSQGFNKVSSLVWKVGQIIISYKNELIAQGVDDQCELVSNLVKVKQEEKIYTESDMKNCFAASRFLYGHNNQPFYRDYNDMITQFKQQTK